jgi:AraC-like DNA-binding protein
MAVSLAKLQFVEPSPEARRLLWHVLSIGSVTRDEPERHESFDKPGAFLFWVTAGEGTLEVGSAACALASGPCCWLLDMGKPRIYRPARGQQLTTNGVRFSGPGLDAWLDKVGAASEIAFAQLSEFNAIRRAHKELLALVKRRPSGYEWQVHLLLNRILGTLLRARKLLSAPPKEIPAAVARVTEAVRAHPARNWKAPELAALAGVSYSALRAVFKQSQQETLHEFLQRTRLDKARLLLCDARLSVKDVARELDFSSEFYFSHFFRKATGMSPTQFRARSIS